MIIAAKFATKLQRTVATDGVTNYCFPVFAPKHTVSEGMMNFQPSKFRFALLLLFHRFQSHKFFRSSCASDDALVVFLVRI